MALKRSQITRAWLGKGGAVLLLLALTACGSKEPRLMNIRNTERGPDEFAVLPAKPLQQPESYAALPAPTPGGANITDPTPLQDAVAALGGNPAQRVRDGRIQVEGPLLNHVARFGIDGSIRQQLAAQDVEFRRRNDGRLLERLFNVNVYYRAYRKQSLDQHAELERFRRLGVRTPAAPPEELAD